MQYDHITDAGLADIKGSDRISLSLIGCKQITDAGLAHLKGLTKLEWLDLDGCSEITDAGLVHLKGLSTLKALYLYRCSGITDAGLVHLKGLSTLKALDLGGCSKITDAGLADIKGLTKLEELYLGGCSGITDAGLVHLKGLTTLKALGLFDCTKITDAGLAHLKGLTKLETLDLRGCDQITDAGLAQMIYQICLCLPEAHLSSPQLTRVQLGGWGPDSAKASAYDRGAVIMYDFAISGARRTFLGLFLHELGHAHQACFGLGELAILREHYTTICERGSVMGSEFLLDSRTRQIYQRLDFTEFLAESYMHYCSQGQRLRDFIGRLDEPARGAWCESYALYRSAFDGAEYA